MFVFAEAATVVKTSGQRNISEEEGVPGGRELEGWGCRRSPVFLLSTRFLHLRFPVCKMGARRLITYIRATGVQDFVKAPKKKTTNKQTHPSGWQSTMGAHHSDSKLLRVKT